MNKVLSSGLWAEIERLAKRSKVRRAAVAYVSSDEHVEFGKGDILIVDASDRAISSGETSAIVLARALKRGATIYSCPGLHAKMFVFDDWAVIGSANVSQSSAHNLIEAGVVSNDSKIVAATHDLLQKLQRQAQVVDRVFLQRIKEMPVHRTSGRARRDRKPPSLKPSHNRSWLVSLWPLNDREEAEYGQVFEVGKARAREKMLAPSHKLDMYAFTGDSAFRSEPPYPYRLATK